MPKPVRRCDERVSVAMGKTGASRGCSRIGAIRRRVARLEKFERHLPSKQPSERLERVLGRGALIGLIGLAGGLARQLHRLVPDFGNIRLGRHERMSPSRPSV